MQALVLGTAQFGVGYGITNTRGRLTDDDVADILTAAKAAGVTAIDTANGYGDAQLRLRPWAADLTITTKIGGLGLDGLRAGLEAGLGDLGVERVDSCLIHDWHLLDSHHRREAARALTAAKAEGLVQAIGISAYGESDLATALVAFDRVDIVQVPANVLDRRLDGSAVIEELTRDGARIQVRSIFLQGLLANPSSTPVGQHPAVLAFHQVCAARHVPPMALALAHVRRLDWATEVVIGVTNVDELVQLVELWAQPPSAFDSAREDIRDLSSDDVDLIDPRNWGKAPTNVRLEP